jgi:hypothetical protein
VTRYDLISQQKKLLHIEGFLNQILVLRQGAQTGIKNVSDERQAKLRHNARTHGQNTTQISFFRLRTDEWVDK